jgi:O-antigen ligase/Flp pilus assembly protein TadD
MFFVGTVGTTVGTPTIKDAELSFTQESPIQPGRKSRAIGLTLQTIIYITLIGLPLLYTSRVHDVFLAKSGLSLVIGGVLGVVWLLRVAARGDLSLNPIWFYGAIVVFVSASCISLILVADNAARGVEVLLLQLVGFVLFASAGECTRSVASAINLMRAVSWTSLVVACIGLLEQSGVFLIAANIGNPFPVATIGNPNFVAHYLDLTIPVSVSLLFLPGDKAGWKTIVTAISLASTTVVMALTECRGGWASVGLVALVFVALKLRSLRWVRFVPIVLLVGALLSPMTELLFNVAQGNDTNTTLYEASASRVEVLWERASSTLDDTDPSRSMRILLWKNTFDMIGAHPLLGVGPGNYEFSLPDFRSMFEQRLWKELTGRLVVGAYYAHNEYLEFLAETGVIGFLAMVVLFGTIMWHGWRYLSGRCEESTDPNVRVIVAGCLGAVGAALVHAVFSFNLQDPVSGTLFWVLAGVLVGLTSEKGRGVTISLESKARRLTVLVVGVGFGIVSISCGLRIVIADGYYLEGLNRYNDGNGLEAVDAMRHASEWRDADFRHHHLLGAFAFNVGEAAGADSEFGRRTLGEAESSLRRSLELNPNNAGALRALGKMLLVLDRGTEALEPLKRTVELKPLEAKNYELLAQALSTTGDHLAALESRKQALSFRPHDTDLMMHLATEFRLSGDLESSAGVLERAAVAKPHDGKVLGNLGSVYLAQGKLVESERLLRKAIEVDPAWVGWRHNLVRSLLRQRRIPLARMELGRALELFPRDGVLEALSRALDDAGDG